MADLRGVNYQQGCRYIVLTSTEKKCRMGLPRRRFMNRSRPGVAGTGPSGAAVGDQDQWEFGDVEHTAQG